MSNQYIKLFVDGHWTSRKCTVGDTVIFKMSVGPTIAQRWLDDHNKCNRKMKPHQIDRITRDILRGQWFDNGQYISFYRNGQIHDGQNRLAAIVRSGRQIKTSVVFGVETEAVRVTDGHTRRTLVDRAKLLGIDCQGKSLRAAKFIIEMQKAYKIYDDEIMDFYSKYQDVFDRVTGVISTKWVSKQPVHSAIALVGIQQPDFLDDIVEFAEKYDSGLGISSAKHPIMKLRNFAMNHRDSNAGPWRKELFLKTIFACRAYLEGKTEIQRLGAVKEDTIYVDDAE